MSFKHLLGVTVLVVAAGCSAQDSTDEDEPDAVPSGMVQTDYIVEQVSREYSTKTNRTFYLECPDVVDLRPGAKMTCGAHDVDDNDKKYADLVVTITNEEGDFDWEVIPTN